MTTDCRASNDGPVWGTCFGGAAAGHWLVAFGLMIVFASPIRGTERPNILFILTDDQRWDALGCSGNAGIRTPHLDRLANRGTRFSNAFVTLSICSPSRAACLTGRYGSANGVTAVGHVPLREGETTFAQYLRDAGYRTGVVGKWHLENPPADCGFDFASTCHANGAWYDREFRLHGSHQPRRVEGFVEEVIADEAIRFISEAAGGCQPFVLWMCTQVPHLDHQHRWPVRSPHDDQLEDREVPLPKSWDDDLQGKPDYLQAERNRVQARTYGYADPAAIRRHICDYHAAVELVDASLGKVLSALEARDLRKNTWVIFMGDNGWFLGEHGFTSKVLPYEESIRVPMVISGPDTPTRVDDHLVLNIDLTATILELAELPVPETLHGRSLRSLVQGEAPPDWRSCFLYQAPTPQLGSRPLWAVRSQRWKYIETSLGNATQLPRQTFVELYDLEKDSEELNNLAAVAEHAETRRQMAETLRTLRREFEEDTHLRPALVDVCDAENQSVQTIATSGERRARTDLCISGVYPHLTTYGVYSQDGAHLKAGHDECGIGAVVPWAGKLWLVNYAPHQPGGSEHKLFSIDDQLKMEIHPKSVGGTPAGRMLHRESNQLLIGHYLIDENGDVRVISPAVMPGRITAIARHLSDPRNMVYYSDMEGMIYEANVRTLEVKKLFQKPVPGWHGKGAYTAQGRLVVANNGEHAAGSYEPLLVGGAARHDDEAGVLAEWDGEQWRIIERRQFTDVTGPDGIYGGHNDQETPLWAIGWDRRSLRLKLLDHGKWLTYLLPKAAHNNDPRHGWYTEWPRIRAIGGERLLMDMHGMFFDFPITFSAANSNGLRPVSSHLRYIPDFCEWNGRLVLASDETSIQGNRLAGQPQSNLWFGNYEDLKTWGPATGYGGPWVGDMVKADMPSEPFLVRGFDRRVLHLACGTRSVRPAEGGPLRASDQQVISQMPPQLRELARVTIERGDWHQPAPGYWFEVNRPVTVYLAVDERGAPNPGGNWQKTDWTVTWGRGLRDGVYQQSFPAGRVEIPANPTEHSPGAFGMPHLAFVASDFQELKIAPAAHAKVIFPTSAKAVAPDSSEAVRFRLEIDVDGSNQWREYTTVEVPARGYVCHLFPEDFAAQWIRLRSDRDCTATAYFHLTEAHFDDGSRSGDLFRGLADVRAQNARVARVYAAKRNRNLRVITGDQRYFDFSKQQFEFISKEADVALEQQLKIEPEFEVDDASVILSQGGIRLRLPKGDDAFDKPFPAGWPRGTREVESERHLANFHGTFYEVPLVTNGRPPAFSLMRPVASHRHQILDFCSWNGLLVLAGIREDATNDGHVFVDPVNNVGLWFGAVDDLWKLGKPVGRGGPWKETNVVAGEPSDAYLMTGYDRKTLTLKADHDVTISLEVDFDHQTGWHPYLNLRVEAGKPLVFRFPSSFSAHWIRFRADRDCRATAWLDYE